jgi:chromate transporter
MGAGSIFLRFLRFGFLAFGGPVAQIAMLRRELVEEEGWLSSDRFNRLLAIYQLLPGPEAMELCVHLGRMKAGRLGGFLAGLGFIVPGFLLVLGLAVAYSSMNLTDPLVAAAFLGAQVAVVALVAVAVQKIGKHILGDWLLWAIAIAALGATIAGASFWIVLPAAGLGYVFAKGNRPVLAAIVILVAAACVILLDRQSGASTIAASATADRATLLALFVAGLKGGLLTFGGAYTAIPFVRDDVVGRGWLGDGQFLDGLALSGMMPAPLVIFVTFVGYLAGGFGGALVITAGMFLPAFSFGLLFYDRLEAMVENERFHRLLEGIAAAVVGIIAATALDLALNLAGRVPSAGWAFALLVLCAAALLILRSRYTALWLIPASALAGALLFQ